MLHVNDVRTMRSMPTPGMSSRASNYLVNEIRVGLVSKMADSRHL